MINSGSSANSWLSAHNNTVDSLNQVMDSVSVLSEVELQKELSLFANAQFTYDIAPGVAANDDAISPSSSSNINAHPQKAKKPDMHSLLNVKLASLVENNYHTSMSPDAIARFYDDSPDCTPPNGYHSPNPSPPNGFHSPNPTPPNGIHLTASSHAGFQGIVNPPITFYGEDAIMGYDDDQFMKTMRLLTSNYDEPQPEAPKPTVAAPTTTTSTATKKRNSISTATVKKSSPLVSNELSTVDSEDDDEDADESVHGTASRRSSQHQAPLTKEDKRRRNTAASARFRVKKKMREQALQQTANEMTEKAKAFENRVHELEREVKWLKALIVEKKDGHLEQILMQQYGTPMAAPSNDSSYHSHHQQMNHVAYDSTMNHHHHHASNNNNNNNNR